MSKADLSWALNLLLLPSRSRASDKTSSIEDKLQDKLGTFADPSSTLQELFQAQCAQNQFPFRSEHLTPDEELELRLVQHPIENGPIVLVQSLLSAADVLRSLSLLGWLNVQAENFPILINELKFFICAHPSLPESLLREFKKYPGFSGVFFVQDQGRLRLEAEGAWESLAHPPASYWVSQGRRALSELRRTLFFDSNLTLSAWVPDLDSGARLFFYDTLAGTPPEELTGTATMFFAMEEMGQVSTDRFALTKQDEFHSVLSIREQAHGKLLGVILLCGAPIPVLSDSTLSELESRVRGALIAGTKKTVGSGRGPDQYATIRKIISTISVDSCLLGLNSCLPGQEIHQDVLDAPNEPSKTVRAGGTQSFVLLNGPGVSICFNLAFLEDNLKTLVASHLKIPVERANLEVIRDFFKEYLNQIIRWTKTALGKQGVPLTMGIPLAIPEDTVVPTFFRNQIYDGGSVLRVDRYRFEIRVAVNISQPDELLHLKPMSVQQLVATQTEEEIDIEALLDARDSIEDLSSRGKSALAEFRRHQRIPHEISISGWTPDTNLGASLQFYNSPGTEAPEELLATAAMFFAMEEMGQVSPKEFAFRIQESDHILVSLRDNPQGKLIGVLLFVGQGADQIDSAKALELAANQRKLFSEASLQSSPASESKSDQSRALSSILSAISLDACLLRLENYLPGHPPQSEELTDLQAPSKLYAAGGTHSYCMLAAAGLTLTFRITFLEGNLQQLVAQSLRLTSSTPSIEIIRDFMREYLNQVVGWVQQNLAHQGLKTKIGLPLTLPHGAAIPRFLDELSFDGGCVLKVGTVRFEVRFAASLTEDSPLPEIKHQNLRESIQRANETIDIEMLLDLL